MYHDQIMAVQHNSQLTNFTEWSPGRRLRRLNSIAVLEAVKSLAIKKGNTRIQMYHENISATQLKNSELR